MLKLVVPIDRTSLTSVLSDRIRAAFGSLPALPGACLILLLRLKRLHVQRQANTGLVMRDVVNNRWKQPTSRDSVVLPEHGNYSLQLTETQSQSPASGHFRLVSA